MKKLAHIAFLYCLTGVFFSCTNHQPKQSVVKQYNKIDSLLSGIDSITPEVQLTDLLFYNEIDDSIDIKTDMYFLCVINADCSHCIANFFQFIDQVKNSNSSLKIFAVVNTLYNKNLSYYAKQAKKQSSFQTIKVSADCWDNKVITDFYELYIIHGNQILKRFLTLPFFEQTPP